jgi:hypothetical protein
VKKGCRKTGITVSRSLKERGARENMQGRITFSAYFLHKAVSAYRLRVFT